MRISGQSDIHTDGRGEPPGCLTPVEGAQNFSRLLEEQKKPRCKPPPGFEDEQRQQRLMACFRALLEGNSRWTDGNVSVRHSGRGRLQWQLLSGPLAGCSIFACWEGRHLSLEMAASGSLAGRLTRVRPQLERQLNRLNSRFLITLKVTRETVYL